MDLSLHPASIAPPRGPTVQPRATNRGFADSGADMWIVMYVAMIASLNAMGLTFTSGTDADRKTYDDV